MAIYDGITTWNYKTKHVQARDNVGTDFDAGQFIRGASCLLVAGPRHFSDVMGAVGTPTLRPIGLLQNGSISQQKQLEEVFEIGSERRYMVTGRTFYQLQAERIMISGGSLMRATYDVRDSNDPNPSPSDSVPTWQSRYPGVNIPADSFSSPVAYGAGPGFRDFYLNLASVFFNKPTGILVIDNDADDQVVGACYLEDCYIQSYNRRISAPQTVVAEQCLIKFDRLVPVLPSFVTSLGFTPAKTVVTP